MTDQEKIELLNQLAAMGIRKPWTQNGWSCGGDTKILVAFDGEIDGIKPAEKHPDAEKVTAIPDGAVVIPIPARDKWPAVKVVNCPTCKGVGALEDCEECDGEGDHTCDCGDTHDCRACNGIGCSPDQDGDTCPDCGGEGRGIERPTPVWCRHILIDAYYLDIMLRLGVTEIYAIDEHNPVAFRFAGGRSAVMPIRG